MGIKCTDCGRFVSYHDYGAMTWTCYGSYAYTEPPEPEYVCGRCWNRRTPENVERLKRSCWMGPAHLFPDAIAAEMGGEG